MALLLNSYSEIPQQVLDGWADRVSEEPNYNANERRLVDNRGILQIDWPARADGFGPVPLDLLLATSNDLETTFPSVETIAKLWNGPEGEARREYFSRNTANGISTFQDQEIAKILN